VILWSNWQLKLEDLGGENFQMAKICLTSMNAIHHVTYGKYRKSDNKFHT